MGQRTKRFLLTGLAAVLPLTLTVYLFYWVVAWIHGNVGKVFNDLLEIPEHSSRTFVGDAVAFLVFLTLVWVAGFLLATYLGAMFFRWLDDVSRRTPILRAVYPAVKQFTDFFLTKKDGLGFNRVVAVEYPRKGVYGIGFVTSDGMEQLRTQDGERLVTLFMPSSPAPFTGYTVFVREKELIPLDITVDEALKIMVSGGVVMPGNKGESSKLSVEGSK